MYDKVSTDMKFVEREKEILEFWKKNGIFNKSFNLRKGNDKFTFYDGPPTANGRPHIGHLLTRAIKDLIPRYKTMQGYDVLRKAGWDTHGLPVEIEVEKKLGLNSKPEIEKYGIEPFISECKNSVWKYLGEWKDMSDRVAYWCDMDNPYVTYHNNYIESVWWSLKKIADKGLIYKGYKVVPYCPRCGTSLSSHEVAQGYKDVTEKSAVVRFKVKDEDNLYLLAWTTTPWTLPSNVALVVNASVDYLEAEHDGERLIFAEPLKEAVFGDCAGHLKILKKFKGSELVGMEYEPLYKFTEPKEKAWYVVADDYVTTTDGTGIVHCAPAFGEDDARVGRDNNLPFVQLVSSEGKFIEGTTWEGTFVKDADPIILKDLNEKGLLFSSPTFTHSYPFCWRCDTPLLYYARATWFIKMTEVRNQLIKNNQSINWMPDHIKDGRMGNFLENVVDWGLSRERYWGTPLPIWICEEGHMHVIGSRAELKEMALCDVDDDMDLHRPYIDRIEIKCPECGKPMHRVTEVIDCWYDSGSMPFAQWHYPFENKEEFESRYPANFISEAIDQTRGWFYTMLAVSTLLFDDVPSYKNCLVLGHVQDENGKKMSKHIGNVVDPWQVLEKQGADAVRWYFYSVGQPWLPIRFSDSAIEESQRKFMGTLQNVYAFFVLYANIDSFNPFEHRLEDAKLTLIDKWILSRLNQLISDVQSNLDEYKILESTKAIGDFVDDLSNWYIRRNRERFWGKGVGKDMGDDKGAAFITLYTVLVVTAKIIAPFVPFIAEDIYQNLVRNVDKNAPESVHFCDFPKVKSEYIDAELNKNMNALIKVVSLARTCRSASNIKVRQPLSKLYVSGTEFPNEYAELLKDEINVKNVEFISDSREFTTYLFKPQMRTIGPKYGKLLGKIGQYLQAIDGNAAYDMLNLGNNLKFEIDGTDVELSKDDVLISAVQKHGFTAESLDGITVVLDTNLSPELIDEGYAREIISKIQTMRKDADFDVTDRITVKFASAKLEKVFEEFADQIKLGVLAKEISKLENSSIKDSEEMSAIDNGYYKTWDINGIKAIIYVSNK